MKKNFKAQLKRDIKNVFLNTAEFGETYTIIYNGETYKNVPAVLTGAKETARERLAADHSEGLFKVSAVLYCAQADLGGVQPEQGMPIRINDEPGSDFLVEYRVAESICEMGMLEVGLERIGQ